MARGNAQQYSPCYSCLQWYRKHARDKFLQCCHPVKAARLMRPACLRLRKPACRRQGPLFALSQPSRNSAVGARQADEPRPAFSGDRPPCNRSAHTPLARAGDAVARRGHAQTTEFRIVGSGEQFLKARAGRQGPLTLRLRVTRRCRFGRAVAGPSSRCRLFSTRNKNRARLRRIRGGRCRCS